MSWKLLDELPETAGWEKMLLAEESGKVLGVASVLKVDSDMRVSPMWMESGAAQYAEIPNAPDLTKAEEQQDSPKEQEEAPWEEEAPKKAVKDDFNDA